jgi:hypothetical protein
MAGLKAEGSGGCGGKQPAAAAGCDAGEEQEVGGDADSRAPLVSDWNKRKEGVGLLGWWVGSVGRTC